MSIKKDIKCTGCRWQYINSDEKSNCTCPSQEITIVDEDDDRTIEMIKECHQYVPLDNDEYFKVDDYDRNSDNNQIGNQYEMVW